MSKKRKYTPAITLSRTRQLVEWDVSDKLTVGVFYHDGEAMIDITNPQKANVSLALTTDQFRTLHAIKDDMGSGSYEYNMGLQIYLKREVYKSKWYVSVRQHYKDNLGRVKPGKNGANMAEDVWADFVSTMDEIGMY
jgi:hypothetical protein